jgi:Na+/melibiose symporter-like transporter
MTIGTSIVLIAVGAILKFAVHTHVSGVSLQTIGVILMVVGVLGLILSFFWLTVWRDRRRDVVVDDRPVVDDRRYVR